MNIELSQKLDKPAIQNLTIIEIRAPQGAETRLALIKRTKQRHSFKKGVY